MNAANALTYRALDRLAAHVDAARPIVLMPFTDKILLHLHQDISRTLDWPTDSITNLNLYQTVEQFGKESMRNVLHAILD